jgi:hypothetical protein
VSACQAGTRPEWITADGEGFSVDATTLSTVASAVLSLGFSYVPKLKDWFEKLGGSADGSDDGGTRKRLVMLGLLVLVSLSTFGLSCAGLGADIGINVACDQPGAIGLLKALVLAIAANQGTYMITKRPKIRAKATIQPEFPF